MFRNRISVVRKARATSKSNTTQSSLGSTSAGGGEKGDGPSGVPAEYVPLPSSVSLPSDTPSVGNESVVMECAKPDEGICIDETVFSMDDSGEIGENELRLAEDDDNDTTKDLDFSRPSPTLFSLTSPKRARMMLEIQKSVDRNASAVSSSTARPSMVTPSTSSSCIKTTIPNTSQSVFGCSANETPQQPAQNRTPWSIRSSVQSKQGGDVKRQSIAGAIDDLNEMTEELIDFIRGFDEKYTSAEIN
ncbi:uncharacterized protein LOC118508977 [Anopheles stephensi]|uniref:uncharacterized protein LOC118508977 n=1 Tax=Anopheles stephensi TaxID=30069 RepID=UPI0016587546|nr:uncharacterized protein LOC118508977 [Anopheles stephensi]XP_035904851.1 uncharacterized protein LOC118508977 [Anopheles stephensi]